MPTIVSFDVEEYPLFMNTKDPNTAFRGWVMSKYSEYESHHNQSEEAFAAMHKASEELKTATVRFEERSRHMEDISSSVRDSHTADMRLATSGLANAIIEIRSVIPSLSSSKSKGDTGELSLMQILTDGIPGTDWAIDHIGKTAHSADVLLTYKSGEFICRLDSKNWTKTVDTDEINKLKSDMVSTGARTGMIVSFHSGVAYKHNDDIETFVNANGDLCAIAYLSRVVKAPAKVWASITALRCIWDNFIKKGESFGRINLSEQSRRIFRGIMEHITSMEDIGKLIKKLVKASRKMTSDIVELESSFEDSKRQLTMKVQDLAATLAEE